jgi:hypothetical protein
MQAQGRFSLFFLIIWSQYSAGKYCERTLNRSCGMADPRAQNSLYCLSLGTYSKIWAGVHGKIIGRVGLAEGEGQTSLSQASGDLYVDTNVQTCGRE